MLLRVLRLTKSPRISLQDGGCDGAEAQPPEAGVAMRREALGQDKYGNRDKNSLPNQRWRISRSNLRSQILDVPGVNASIRLTSVGMVYRLQAA